MTFSQLQSKGRYHIWSHLTDINANIIFIISSVAHCKPKLVLAVHSMQIYFLGQRNEKLVNVCCFFKNMWKYFAYIIVSVLKRLHYVNLLS